MTDDATNDEAIDSAADQLAAEIRRRRKAAGLSQRQLAPLCGYTREYVSMAERLDGNLPSYELIRAMDGALKADGALIDLRTKAQEEQRALRGQLQIAGTRREVPAVNLSSLSGDRVGAGDIDRLYLHTARLRRLDNMFGGGDTYKLYAALADQSSLLLRQGLSTEANNQRLRCLVAEQHQLAGWAAFDAGDQGRAQTHYTDSLTAAEEAGDAALAGNALAFLAYQQIASNEDATKTADASYVRASDVATPRVATLLLERKAWVYSVRGDHRQADTSLNLAREALQRSDDRPEPDWVFWVDEVEIDIMTGRCWTELGRPLRAVPVLERVLAAFSDTHGRDKSLYLTWLASAYIQASEPEHGAATLVRAHELANGVASVRPLERVRTIARQLDRHRRVPEVVDALERIGV